MYFLFFILLALTPSAKENKKLILRLLKQFQRDGIKKLND